TERQGLGIDHLGCFWPGEPSWAVPWTGWTSSTYARVPSTTRQSQAPRTSCMSMQSLEEEHLLLCQHQPGLHKDAFLLTTAIGTPVSESSPKLGPWIQQVWGSPVPLTPPQQTILQISLCGCQYPLLRTLHLCPGEPELAERTFPDVPFCKEDCQCCGQIAATPTPARLTGTRAGAGSQCPVGPLVTCVRTSFPIMPLCEGLWGHSDS
ncbi:hypothetical protein J0S82_010159, partial [Galemys pyrenaicus]